ncbi:hypothetical protein BGZ58_001136 [Dissophora ornata]|nr:hypothetical protein BGZ58_001136 [Dissophora ornata]
MKIRQEDFLHLKDQIFQVSQDLEDKEGILGEIRGERKILQSELHRHIAMVKQIQKDFELAQQAEIELIKERDQLSQHLTQLKHHDFKTLKEEVDQLRLKKRLRPLPSLEQEEAEFMGRYLEQRRGQWREDGTQDPVSLSNDHNHSSPSYGGSSSNNEAGPSLSSRTAVAAAGQSSSKSSRASTSSSSLASATTSIPRERDNSGRSWKARAVSPGHTRSSSSLGKSKHESSSRAGTGGRSSSSSSSKSVRQSHSRSQSPAPTVASSATSRAERSEKRSRY